ncbi:hypothetical protein WKW50_24760 [Ochrobactrum sp. GPK 3]
MTRTALEGSGKAGQQTTLSSKRRVVNSNPLQVKVIAQAHVKTDKIDAGTLADLYATGHLPEI